MRIPVDDDFAVNLDKLDKSGFMIDEYINTLITIDFNERKNILYKINLKNIKENELMLKFNMMYVIKDMEALKHKLDITNCIDIFAFVKECNKHSSIKNEIIYRYSEQSERTKSNYEVQFSITDNVLSIEIVEERQEEIK